MTIWFAVLYRLYSKQIPRALAGSRRKLDTKAPIWRGDINVTTDVSVAATFSEPEIGRIAAHFATYDPSDVMATEPCPRETRDDEARCNVRVEATANEDGSATVCASCANCINPAWPREIVDEIVQRTEERAAAGEYI